MNEKKVKNNLKFLKLFWGIGSPEAAGLVIRSQEATNSIDN